MDRSNDGRFCQNTQSENKRLGQLLHKGLPTGSVTSVLLLKRADKKMAKEQIQAYKQQAGSHKVQNNAKRANSLILSLAIGNKNMIG